MRAGRPTNREFVSKQKQDIFFNGPDLPSLIFDVCEAKRPRRKTGHSATRIAKVQNAWSYTSSPLTLCFFLINRTRSYLCFNTGNVTAEPGTLLNEEVLYYIFSSSDTVIGPKMWMEHLARMGGY